MITGVKVGRVKWIDALKIIAAGGVFLSHYAGAFASDGNSFIIKLLNGYLLSGILNGELWVIIFCAISGYLLGKKKISTIRELITAIIHRYFRFFFPVLFANLFVYVIHSCIGFQTMECGVLLENTWLYSQYANHIDLVSVIKNTILFGGQLNQTFWIIRHMYIASCLIYLTSFLESRLNKRSFVFKLVVSSLMISSPYVFFVGCCYIGAWIQDVAKELGRYELSRKIWTGLFIYSVIMLCGGQKWLAVTLELGYLHMNVWWELLYVLILLFNIFGNNRMQQILEYFAFKKNGSQLSLSVYLIHWPLICSFSTWYYLFLYGSTASYTVSYILSLVATIVLVAFCAYIVAKLIGKVDNIASTYLNKFLQRINLST